MSSNYSMEIFEFWFLNFNKQMETQGKKVLLLVDNAGGHNITLELIKKLTQVEVYFLPQNTTSIIQPCDLLYLINLIFLIGLRYSWR